MRDWERYVRDHLRVRGLDQARETRIVRELAAQLEDACRDALARGMSADEADSSARAQVPDWPHFAHLLESVEGRRVRTVLDRIDDRIDARAGKGPGRWIVLAHFWQDLRYAVRQFAAQPLFLMVCVLTIALGIGANTAIFSIIDTVLLESLPVDRPRELVLLRPDGPRDGWVEGDYAWSYPAYVDLRERQDVLSGLIAERTDGVNFTIDGHTRRANASIVSGNYFDVLGVRPHIGRLLSPADDSVRGGHPVAVLGYGFWVEQLGMRPDIVGHDILVGARPFTVVGIAERRFSGLKPGDAVDVFVPSAMLAGVVGYGSALDSRAAHIFHISGRLAPGTRREDAEARLQPLYLSQLEQDLLSQAGGSPSDDGRRNARLVLEDGRRGLSGLRDDLGRPLLAVMVMTAALLLIACANIAGLQITRAAARVKEISIRLAIGGSRRRVVCQLLTEGLVVSVLGTLAAVAVAFATIHALVSQMEGMAVQFPPATRFLDGQVLLFALVLAVVSTIIVGLVPALLATRPAVWPALRATARADGHGTLRLRRVLVTSQLALCLVLVTAAGLFGRTVYNLLHADTRFDTAQLVQFNLDPGSSGHDRERSEQILSGVLASLRTLPGVDSAALTVVSAFSGAPLGFSGLEIEDYDDRGRASGNAVAPGYFDVLGAPLVRGRDFTDADHSQSRRVAIVNEAFVSRYFPDSNPIGRTVGYTFGRPPVFSHEIVGVARDLRYDDLHAESGPAFYVPHRQFDVLSNAYFMVRSSIDPAILRRSIDDLVQSQTSGLPVVDYITVEDRIDRRLRPERLVASLSGAFGLLATILSAVGLYGVMAFSVARRTREIGLRMALGADRRAVIRMILGSAAGMCLTGIIVGALAAVGLGRYVESMLYGVTGIDAATLIGAAIVLVAATVAAGWFPARKASRIDPMRALRIE